MSVWELKVKHPEKYRGIKSFYMVTCIDPKDKNAKENLIEEFNSSSDFHDFKKSVKGAKCVATMNPDSASRTKGVYRKEELKEHLADLKEGYETEAKQTEKKSHELGNLIEFFTQS